MPLKITYIGHATVLIEWNGLNVLTDPNFSRRILLFRRLQPLAFAPTQLPKLDAVLLSHAHYDHLDHFSYKFIPGDVPIIIPEGMQPALAGLVNNPLIELATWSHFHLKGSTEIYAVPAKHPGGRLFWPYRYRRCHGYVLSHDGEQIYFAGDTGYDTHFQKIGSHFPLRLALLPHAVAAANFWNKRRHMNGAHLMQAWEDLGQPDCIPIHWGSFFKLFNAPDHVRADWQKLTAQNTAFAQKFHPLAPGESFSLPSTGEGTRVSGARR